MSNDHDIIEHVYLNLAKLEDITGVFISINKKVVLIL
jgi:hypothetical protein